jgi:hypothetical protein
MSVKAFYEKVIKSRPTWRPSLLVAFDLHKPRVVRWGAVKGVPQGTFIWTLDSSPRHFIILELGTKRDVVQWSFRSLMDSVFAEVS